MPCVYEPRDDAIVPAGYAGKQPLQYISCTYTSSDTFAIIHLAVMIVECLWAFTTLVKATPFFKWCSFGNANVPITILAALWVFGYLLSEPLLIANQILVAAMEPINYYTVLNSDTGVYVVHQKFSEPSLWLNGLASGALAYIGVAAFFLSAALGMWGNKPVPNSYYYCMPVVAALIGGAFTATPILREGQFSTAVNGLVIYAIGRLSLAAYFIIFPCCPWFYSKIYGPDVVSFSQIPSSDRYAIIASAVSSFLFIVGSYISAMVTPYGIVLSWFMIPAIVVTIIHFTASKPLSKIELQQA